MKVRAKFWGEAEPPEAHTDMGGSTHAMKRVGDSHVWEADLPTARDETHALKVSFKDAHGKIASKNGKKW